MKLSYSKTVRKSKP